MYERHVSGRNPPNAPQTAGKENTTNVHWRPLIALTRRERPCRTPRDIIRPSSPPPARAGMSGGPGCAARVHARRPSARAPVLVVTRRGVGSLAVVGVMAGAR